MSSSILHQEMAGRELPSRLEIPLVVRLPAGLLARPRRAWRPPRDRVEDAAFALALAVLRTTAAVGGIRDQARALRVLAADLARLQTPARDEGDDFEMVGG